MARHGSATYRGNLGGSHLGSITGSIAGVKLSVSLPEEDIHFVDDYAERAGYPSRSSVLHQAIELLRLSELEDAYGAAWREWSHSGDADLWDAVADDGLTDAAR